MPLVFDKEINLTEYAGNPEPSVVQDLAIVHESKDGDITQYYRTIDSYQGGDKESKAIGIYHERTSDQDAYYTYVDYDELEWTTKGASRITRQKIDRLGVKAFPNEGAIAFYKLAFRNLSRIVAPVNYVTKKHAAPTLEAELRGNRIHIIITPPPKDSTQTDYVVYQCYRVYLKLLENTLSYVSYEPEFDIPMPDTTGTYECWCVGYINEGEATSYDSNILELQIQGSRNDWADWPNTYEKITLNMYNHAVLELERVDKFVNFHFYTTEGVGPYPYPLNPNNLIPAQYCPMTDQIFAMAEYGIDATQVVVAGAGLLRILTSGLVVMSVDNSNNQVRELTGVYLASDVGTAITDVEVKSAKTIEVSVNDLLQSSISTYDVIVNQSKKTLRVSNCTVVDENKVRVTLADAITTSIIVRVKAHAFRNPTDDTKPFSVDVSVISLSDYTDTESGMTVVSFSSDDGNTSFSVPSGTQAKPFEWKINNNKVTTIYLSGNSYMGFNANSENLKVNRRDTYINKYAYQLIEVGNSQVLKVRWEGWSPYSSRTDPYKYIWEVFLVDNGDVFLHLASKGNNTRFDGIFTLYGKTYILDDNLHKNVIFTRTGTLGTSADDWSVSYDDYKIIYT